MKASKRAALALIVKRYTSARTRSKESAAATLIDEGIYAEDGRVALAYGGTGESARPPRKT